MSRLARLGSRRGSRSGLQSGLRSGPRVELGPEAAALVEQRRQDALALAGDCSSVAERITVAPPGYLLTQEPANIARQCRLVEPQPTAGAMRVAVTPAPDGWCVDVAGRDRTGFLASVTGVLARHGLDVRQAVIATWDDGAALDAFVVHASRPPDPAWLQHDLELGVATPLPSEAVPDATVAFDDTASRWYTRCDVRAQDRPGLFHAFAAAIASAGIDVHAGRATTTDDDVLDRFDLTDIRGNKLATAHQTLIRERIRVGVPDGAVGS